MYDVSAGISASISKISAVYVSKNENNNLIKTIKNVAIFNFFGTFNKHSCIHICTCNWEIWSR